MVNLQVGHSVQVRSPKPEWRDMHPNFTIEMDKYVGQVLKVARIIDRPGYYKGVYLEGTSGIIHYQWRLEWLSMSLNGTIQNGDLL